MKLYNRRCGTRRLSLRKMTKLLRWLHFKLQPAVGFGCLCFLFWILFIFVFYIRRELIFLSGKYRTATEEESRYSMMDSGEFVHYLASHLRIEYRVIGNYGYDAKMHEVILRNNGNECIFAGDWSIYFNSLHLLEYDILKYNKSYQLETCNFTLEHMDGGLHKLTPTLGFEGILPHHDTVVKFKSHTTASRHYILPKWYISSPGHEPQLIKSTDCDPLDFVTPFSHPEQWKRSDSDYTGPLSLDKRYEIYFAPDLKKSPVKILPTPIHSELNEDVKVDLKSGHWVICNNPTVLKYEIAKFALLFGLKLLPETEPCPPNNIVRFIVGEVEGVPKCNEAYQITINEKNSYVEILTPGPAGAFYAIQTLLSLAEMNNGKMQYSLPTGVIKDAPRFGYRGLHVDVARNFIKVDDLITIIETMALYKLNKLHLHLTDDEGWRIEIDGLPELTTVGSVRKHSDDEHGGLYPALGSGPSRESSGTGYYTISDYKEILKVAELNHIEVIPEVDMPGHCHAAIRAMEARYRRLVKEGKTEEAEEFLISDFNDTSSAISVQHYRNNAINPCMQSTYRFVDHIVKSFVSMHEDVQPLNTIHMGGDEVASNSWKNSPKCNDLVEQEFSLVPSHRELQAYFMQKVSEICGKKYGLSLGLWEDGVLRKSDNKPYEKSSMHDTDVIAYAWDNAWKRPSVERPYKLANAGYKVVMSQATHLYFDHPQEPDPDERGLFWATRFIDDKKVFDFLPEDLYGNAKLDKNGAPFSSSEMDKIRESNVQLKKPENIIGMQAQIWSELLRDISMVHSQLFPRLIAFAERAWHRASWEAEDTRDSRALRNQDWTDFANVVGYKEIPRLKERGIQYRIPPPGVKVVDGTMLLTSLYPGFTYKHRPWVSDIKPLNWSDCDSGDPITELSWRHEFFTSDGNRQSRIVKMN